MLFLVFIKDLLKKKFKRYFEGYVSVRGRKSLFDGNRGWDGINL